MTGLIITFIMFVLSLSSNSRFSITYMTVGFQSWCLCWVSSCCSRFLDSLCRVLDSYLPKMSGLQLLKAVYCLCLLGHFPSAPLEQLLQSSTLEQFNTTGKTTALWLLILLFFSLLLVFILYFPSWFLNFIHLFSSAPKFLYNQERMFQTVDLCLRLDRPPLPRPLTVPPSLLGDPAPSRPSVSPLLSQGLRSVVGDQVDTVLQEMVVVENFYLIGKDRISEERS